MKIKTRARMSMYQLQSIQDNLVGGFIPRDRGEDSKIFETTT